MLFQPDNSPALPGDRPVSIVVPSPARRTRNTRKKGARVVGKSTGETRNGSLGSQKKKHAHIQATDREELLFGLSRRGA